MTQFTHPAQNSPHYSIPSILAVLAAIASFFMHAGVGFMLAIAAIILGAIGLMLSLAPSVRGGVISIVSMIAGALGILVAIIKFIV